MDKSEYWPVVRRQGKRLVGWTVFALVVLLTLVVLGVSVGPLPSV